MRVSILLAALSWTLAQTLANAQQTGVQTLAQQECGCPDACAYPIILNLSCGQNATWYYFENDTNTVQPSIFVDWLGVQSSFVMAPLLLESETLPINCSAPNTDFSVFNTSNIVSYADAMLLLNYSRLVQLSPTQCLLDMPPSAPLVAVYTLFLALTNILTPGNSTYLTLSYLPPSNITLFELNALGLVDDHIAFALEPLADPFPPCCALPAVVLVDLLTANGTAVLCASVPAPRLGQTNVYQLPLGLETNCAYDFETVPSVDITYFFRVRLVDAFECAVGPNTTFVSPGEFNATLVFGLTQSPTLAPTLGPTMVGPDFTGLAHDLFLGNASCPLDNSPRAVCAGGGEPRAQLTGTAFWNSSFVVTNMDSVHMAQPYPFAASLPNVVFTQGPPNVTETSWQLVGQTCNHIVSFVVQGGLLSVHDAATHKAQVYAVHMPPVPGLQGCDGTPGCVPGNETYHEADIRAITPARWDTMNTQAVYDITLPQMSDPDLRLTIDFVRVTFRVNASFHLTQIINPAYRALIMNDSAYENYPEYKDGHVCRLGCQLLVNETAGRWNSQVPSDWMSTHCAYDAIFNKERFFFTPANWIFGTHAGVVGTFTLDFFLKVRRCTGGDAVPVSAITNEAQIAGNQTACVAFTMETINEISTELAAILGGVFGGLVGALAIGGGIAACVINRKKESEAADVLKNRLPGLPGPGPAPPARAPAGTKGFQLSPDVLANMLLQRKDM